MTRFEDATNVTVEYKKSYKVVTVKQPSQGYRLSIHVQDRAKE